MSETKSGRRSEKSRRKEMLDQLLHPVKLPNSRKEFPENMLPITAKDREMIDRRFGRDIADAVLHMQVDHARNGGINPVARQFLYPNGIDRAMDTDALQIILINHLTWDEHNDS